MAEFYARLGKALLPTDKAASGIVIRIFSQPFDKADDALRAEGAYITWGDIDPEICAISALARTTLQAELVPSAPSVRHDRKWTESTRVLVIAAARRISASAHFCK